MKDKAQAIVDDIAKDKAVAMTKLEAAKPALEDAENALSHCVFACRRYCHIHCHCRRHPMSF